MPLFQGTAPAGADVDVDPGDGWQLLTVTTDINQADVDVVLHSAGRSVVVARGRGVLLNRVQLDPEIVRVSVLPSSGSVDFTATLSPSPS